MKKLRINPRLHLEKLRILSYKHWHVRLIAALLITALYSGIVFAQAKPITGNDWLKVDKKTRVQLVMNFMKDVKNDGVAISKDTKFYCQKLDKLYAKKPNLLTDPVWKVLKTAMIMECDWKVNGKDPDAIARDWLGEDLYKKWQKKWGNCPPK